MPVSVPINLQVSDEAIQHLTQACEAVGEAFRRFAEAVAKPIITHFYRISRQLTKLTRHFRRVLQRSRHASIRARSRGPNVALHHRHRLHRRAARLRHVQVLKIN